MQTFELCKKLPALLLGAVLGAASLNAIAADEFPYEVDGDSADSTAPGPGAGPGSPGDYGDGIYVMSPPSGEDADTVFLQECAKAAGDIRLPLNEPATSKYITECGAGWAGGLFNTDYDPNSDSATNAFEQVFYSDSMEADWTHHKTDNKDERPIGGAPGLGMGVGGDSNTWECVRKSNVTNKLDLKEGVVAFYTDAIGNIHAHAAGSRDSNDGEANLGVWYLKDDNVGCVSSGSATAFTGTHLDGDLLVVSEFSQGGVVATVNVFRWTDGGDGIPESGDETLPLIFSGANCSGAHATSAACGENNEGFSIFPAWQPETSDSNATGKGGKPLIGELPTNQWSENVAQIIAAGSGECFAKVLVETRSSTSLSASLHDYAIFDVDICGSVTIEKVTLGDTGTFTIETTTLQGGNFDLTTTAVNTPASKSFTDVVAGDYDATETVPAGWELIGMTCSGDTDGGSTYPVVSPASPITAGNPGTFNIDLDIGENITCRFTNQALGEVAAVKDIVNACADPDGGLFTLRLDGVAKAENVGDGGGFGPLQVTPGTYTIDEIAGTATDLADYTSSVTGDCVDAAGTSSTVDVGTGESKSCTIINVRRPTVTVNKEVTGGSLATFDLLIDDGNDGVDYETEAQGDGGTTGAVNITTVLSGSGATTTYGPVLVGETVANGPGNTAIGPISGFQSYWSCDDTGATQGSGTSVTIPSLLPGEHVTCTVTNIPVAAAACTPGS
ncbi:hypothetical protein GCM10009104_18090 [Marinobacterium maritimum]|uniref:Ig-like domain-containing protein n=1 Tax=Marinobacterium maritimum TaxID=500162 RepID=A0ABP3T955_9GAMM